MKALNQEELKKTEGGRNPRYIDILIALGICDEVWGCDGPPVYF